MIEPGAVLKPINTAVNLGSGLLSDSTVLDETWALTRASNKPLYVFALLWTSYSLSFGDSDSGHNTIPWTAVLSLAEDTVNPDMAS